MNRLITHISVE
jgi:hypothetical protein